MTVASISGMTLHIPLLSRSSVSSAISVISVILFFLCFSFLFRLSSASRHSFPFLAVSTLGQGFAPDWLPHVWVAIRSRHDTFFIYDVIDLDPSTLLQMLCNHSTERCLFFSSFLSTVMWSSSLTLLCLWLVPPFPFLYGFVPLYIPVVYFMYRNLILG